MLQGDWDLELPFRSSPPPPPHQQHAIFSHHIVQGQCLGLSLGDEGAEISDDDADKERTRSVATEWPSRLSQSEEGSSCLTCDPGSEFPGICLFLLKLPHNCTHLTH